ncbi:hypothetical protein [uncultured Clostridium sp.]|uniref:hypothetical protein n=1 Tax=uncultured Clostridium sp. TaxID=59620 RepID=UPI0027DCC05D|nr:hypothetical protein [uncultured Clostridium sp.]
MDDKTQNIQKIYNEWRKEIEVNNKMAEKYGGSMPVYGSWDCGEAEVREDFSESAGLDNIISFDKMFELEKNYIDPSMIIKKAEKLIDSAEENAQQSLFGKQEKDFILNYAYQSQDLKRTEKLADLIALDHYELSKGTINPDIKYISEEKLNKKIDDYELEEKLGILSDKANQFINSKAEHFNVSKLEATNIIINEYRKTMESIKNESSKSIYEPDNINIDKTDVTEYVGKQAEAFSINLNTFIEIAIYKVEEIEKAHVIEEAKKTITNMEKLLKDNPELKNDSKFMQIGKKMYDLVQKEGFNKFYGRVDRLGTDGKIGETLLFDNEEKYRDMINDCTECGDPVTYKKISEKEYNQLNKEQEGKEIKEKDLER